MPTTSAAPALSTRPTLTTKNPTTTTTTSSFIETISASNVDGSTQTSIIPSVTNSAIHKPILGDPSLDGAYKFIGIILIYSVVFLICFIIFAILTCRAITTQTKTFLDPAIRLNTIRKKQRTNTFKSLEDDQTSVASMTPFAGVGFSKPGASKQFKRRASEHEIRCHSENTVPGFNRNYDYTHDMFFQTKSSRAPSPSRRSSNDITTSSLRKGEGPSDVPNRSNEEIEYNTQAQAIELLHDGGHRYTIKQPRELSSRRDDRDQHWSARSKG
jgi:hypothetical protein